MMGAGVMGKSPIEHWVAAEYGTMLYEDGDTVRAKQYLEKALEILSKSPVGASSASTVAEYHLTLGKIYWALDGKWRKEPAFAYGQLSEAASVEGLHQAEAYALLGKYASEVEGSEEKAKLYYEKSLELNPHQVKSNTDNTRSI